MSPPSSSPSVSSPPCAVPEADHHRWFREEVQPHGHSLKAHIYSSYPSLRSEVDDLVQESYLRVWQRQLREPIQSAKSFLYKIARHLAIDAIRHNSVSPIDEVTETTVLSVIDSKPNAAEAACTNHEIEFLLQAIEALPARCREVVILRKLQGVSQKEIARRLGLSEQTVQVQASRGLRRCQEYLRERGLIREHKA